ncbi:MAG: hypothetical protein ACREFR_00580, partial [Limisphaerales bacterium]
LQEGVASQQATQDPQLRELRAAAKFLTELGRSGRLPGIFAHHGHEQVTTGTLPSNKEVEYPFLVTFHVNEVGETSSNHYTLEQAMKDAPWQLDKAWRTGPQGHAITEWPVK